MNTLGPCSLPYRLILGSSSPRREFLLRQLELPFEKRVVPIEEIPNPDIKPEDIALHLAVAKSMAIPVHEGELLLTADTTVWCEGKVLGKPVDREEALLMLHWLAGRWHRVDTGVCLRTPTQEVTLQATTLLHWYPLTTEEIEWYVDRFEPYDKAGAYGIQEWMGMRAIKTMEGCPLNVMGLPVSRLYESLVSEFGLQTGNAHSKVLPSTED